MAFDIDQFEPVRQRQEAGIPVAIKHPVTGEPTGIVITVASYESERVKKVAREMGNKALLDQRRNPRKGETVEAIEDRTFAIAIAAIVDWEGIEQKGKPLAFSRENARMLLEKLPWVAEQIDQAAGDRTAFFGN